MDEQTKEVLKKYLVKLLEGAEKGVDFAAEQAPLVAQEIVVYGRATNTTFLVLAAVLLIASLIVFGRQLFKAAKLLCADGSSNEGITRLGIGFSGSFLSAMCLVPVVTMHINPTLKSWFAPRLYLIEYLKDLVK